MAFDLVFSSRVRLERHKPVTFFRKFVARGLRAIDLVTHMDRHHNVRQALAKPIFREVRAKQRLINFKYLHPLHLVVGLSTDQKAKTMIHHYNFLSSRFEASTLFDVLNEGIILWQKSTASGCHKVDLVFSHPTDNEGELTLRYKFDESIIHVCSFSFAPGSLIDASVVTILAVTRMQGSRNQYEQIRLAMRSLYGLSPSTISMTILEGLAGAFSLSTLAGVAADAQVCSKDLGASAIKHMYDAEFIRFGGIRVSPQFYIINLPAEDKPLGTIKSSNRSRAKRQRDLRREIACAVQRALTINESPCTNFPKLQR